MGDQIIFVPMPVEDYKDMLRGIVEEVVKKHFRSAEPRMGVSEAAKFLGLSESSVYKYAQSGQMPCKKIGSRYTFLVEELRGWELRF